MKKNGVTAALFCGASILAFSPAAFAQDGADSAIAAAADEAAAGDPIVVTGSRVIVSGDNSPTPLTVVSTDDLLTAQPSTISDAVNNLPVFSAPRTQVSNPNAGIGAGGGGNAVANQLNLRNLLPQRTLVLFDGHRIAPTTSTGIVDVDTIPQYLLKRVEVVTGGVSAVYGSDAVAGVVNFITDKDFMGVKAHAQYGISERGDAAAWQAGVAYGADVGDRGHFIASYEFRDDDGVDRRSSRPSLHRWTVQGNGSETRPFFITGDAVRADQSFGGLIRTGVLAGQEFAQNGVLSSRTLGSSDGVSSPLIRLGGDGAWYDGSLKASQRSHQAFARFDYDFSDTMRGYVEGAANFKRNTFWGQDPTLANMTMSVDNAFLPDAYRQLMVDAGQSTFNFSKFITSAPRIHPVIDETQYFINTGLEGEFGDGWNWDLGYIYSTAKIENEQQYNLNNLKLAAALDSVIDPGTMQAVCNVTLTNPGLFPGCVPINVFGPTSESQEALDYVFDTTHFTAFTKQHDISMAVTGTPFSTWAGDVRVALSGEWRKQSYRSTSDMDPAPVGTDGCDGLRFNCNPATTQQWFQTYPNRSTVSQSVGEGALEVNVPLLADSPMAQRLDVNGAVRYTHYNTSGNYWTWKVGLDWELSDSLRFRATKSRDIRAPTLDDLFAATGCFPANTTDLLLNASNTAIDCTSGNPTLTAEIGKTFTVGAVFKPNFIPGLSMSLDYFNIEIDDAITTVVGTNQTIQQGCYDSGGTSLYCTFQDRALGSYTDTSAANVVTAWRRGPINISRIKTWGLDYEINYRTTLAGRPLSLRGLATYQPHMRFYQPGLLVLDMGGIAFGQNGTQANPKWRVTGFVNYQPTDNFTINLMHRWRSHLGITADPSQFTTGPETKAYATTNLNLAWEVPSAPGDMEFFVSVQNLFDNLPPPANFGGTQVLVGLFGGFPIGDDPIGRYFTSGVKFKF